MPRTDLVIGLDFDNTLVSYDQAMHETALELNLISADKVVQSKEQTRDYIRGLPDGEVKWQILQAEVYGKRMGRARLIEGVEKFVRACKDHQIPTFIVSHKSKYAAQDTEKINLQTAALDWMRQNRFFDRSGLGLAEDGVYFEDSREEKSSRIHKLGCTHFIDDLVEFFLEKSFPQETARILFSPGHVSKTEAPGIKVFQSWDEIYQSFFVNNIG